MDIIKSYKTWKKCNNKIMSLWMFIKELQLIIASFYKDQDIDLREKIKIT